MFFHIARVDAAHGAQPQTDAMHVPSVMRMHAAMRLKLRCRAADVTSRKVLTLTVV
jgi:hypothetical protein